MSDTHRQQSRPDSQQQSSVQQAAQGTQDTWDGGGREPMHPDDIDSEGELLGEHPSKQQLRSDDN